jgi:hypothetical protein
MSRPSSLSTISGSRLSTMERGRHLIISCTTLFIDLLLIWVKRFSMHFSTLDMNAIAKHALGISGAAHHVRVRTTHTHKKKAVQPSRTRRAFLGDAVCIWERGFRVLPFAGAIAGAIPLVVEENHRKEILTRIGQSKPESESKTERDSFVWLL